MTTPERNPLAHGLLQTRKAPRPADWRVRGQNVITPDHYGYFRAGNGDVAEVTIGDFMGATLYGVTFNRLPDLSVDPRDKACHSLQEVIDTLDVWGTP